MKYHPLDLMDALDNMVLIVDTREQDTPRARARYKNFRRYEREKLDFGDYTAKIYLPDETVYSLADKVVIERKMSLDELCLCYTHDRGRFEREFERAAEKGAKTYLLVENATWEKVYSGDYRSKMRATALTASLLTWLCRYNCTAVFCKPATTGALIRDILYREAKERLEVME